MMLAAVIALKAYSIQYRFVSSNGYFQPRSFRAPHDGITTGRGNQFAGKETVHTDLVQSSLLGEDRDVSVVS